MKTINRRRSLFSREAQDTPERGRLTGIHFLTTYRCLYECDHCFIWSSPSAVGTFSTGQIEQVMRQAKDLGTVDMVFFEGGEPFLYYPVLLKGVQLSRDMGFKVGIVTNGYWATDPDDAVKWLEPLARLGIEDFTVSIDEYHGKDEAARTARNAKDAAERLRMPVSVSETPSIERYACESAGGEGGSLYFRGRASQELAKKALRRPWKSLTDCPEEPPTIGRVHVDAQGNVQFCQGITIGNLWKTPLKSIMEGLDPPTHPIIGPLMRGGPAQLSKELGIRPRKGYADACHMCYELRAEARRRGMFPEILTPDQAYGVLPE